MTVTLKRLGPGDTLDPGRIAPEVFDEPVDPALLDAYLRDPNHLLIVALDGDLVVGQCGAAILRHPHKPADFFVDELFTAPSHQRQGIGAGLLEAMLAWARELGHTEAWLTTDMENGPANALYGKLGGVGEPLMYYEFKL